MNALLLTALMSIGVTPETKAAAAAINLAYTAAPKVQPKTPWILSEGTAASAVREAVTGQRTVRIIQQGCPNGKCVYQR